MNEVCVQQMRLFSLIFFLLLFILAGHPVGAQHPNIFISSLNQPNETSIALYPGNTDWMVAAANNYNGYYSSDGGYTWTHFAFNSPWGINGDPVLVTDTAGSFYCFHLSYPPSGGGHWLDRIVCQRMDGFSQNWSMQSFVGTNGAKHQDKPWAAIDAHTNRLYLCWTQFDRYGSTQPSDSSNILFSQSSDRGQTWSAPVRINGVAGDCADSDNTVEGAVPAVGPNGQVYVSWAGPQGIMFDRSLDGGNTWLQQDIPVYAPTGGWDYSVPGLYRANGLPVTACDTGSSPYHGSIYVNWTDQGNGTDNTDVWVIRSTDGGNTWQAPVRVNNDLGLNRHQFLSWMCVDQANGQVYVVFYDRRNYDQQNTDVYLACSFDGGNSFTNVKISETPFLPSSGYFMGDYIGVSAYNQVVRPVWTRLDNGQLSVWTALVNHQLLMVSKPEALPMASLEDGYPNPFRDETRLAFGLSSAQEVCIEVFDCAGRPVKDSGVKAYFPAGKHEYVLSAGLCPGAGIYTVSLQTKDARLVKRVVLTR